MKAFYFVIAITALAASASADVAIQEEHPIDWYNCAGKPDGNYEHPWDCTRFISCSGGIASQRDCANCDIDPVRCPEGRTVYDPSVDACLWADQTTCSSSNSTQTPPITNSTSRPTPPTQPPVTNSTAEPTTPSPGGPVEGGPCNPDECITHGDCDRFLICSNETGSWVWTEKLCGPGLIWNPHNPDGSDHIHGGNCDYFRNLQQSQKDKYRDEEECLKCYWKDFGKCSNVYEYQRPGLEWRAPENLTCNDDLVFVLELETCQKCDTVIGEDGNPCC
ncbi:unnamed protein product [Orchesella dallaii]|uniref:Chitin-binding type-2 domain-containing protein n=1 Tax=Orchesella dallaii TaxID=48710 RepID=A0ABP1Q742_9HEXA